MYPPKHFQIKLDESSTLSEQNKLLNLVANNPLATLIFNNDELQADISHIPFHVTETEKSNELNELSVLIGHVSKQHPLAKRLANNNETINLVFHGEQAYISPNMLPNKTHNSVPTWNYAKVHITGKAIEITSIEEKYQQMSQTTEFFEQGQQTPWLLPQTASKPIMQMLNAICIFKVNVVRVEGRFKLSQNKSADIRAKIAEQVAKQNKPLLAQQIQNF